MAAEASTAASLEVEPLAGALGAEVRGVSLAEELDEAILERLQDAWMQHQVLFFRDQDISRDQHKAFGRRFGELHTHPILQPLKEQGHPEIFVLFSDAERPFVAADWHSDVTFEQEPPMASILRAVEVPDHGGDTLWASMYAAYEALSDTLQRFLSSLSAVHDPGLFRAIASEEQKQEIEEKPKTVHPVVRTHPVTGRKALFVNRSFTHHIKGMKPAESASLLSFLYEHLSAPDFTCRFRWRKNSVAMWDNRCTQHRVLADNLHARRHMERITLMGDLPR